MIFEEEEIKFQRPCVEEFLRPIEGGKRIEGRGDRDRDREKGGGETITINVASITVRRRKSMNVPVAKQWKPNFSGWRRTRRGPRRGQERILLSFLLLSLRVFRRLGTWVSAKHRLGAVARAGKVLMKGEAIDPIRYWVSRFDLRPGSGRALR